MYNKYNYQQVQTTIQKLKLKTISNDRNSSKLGSQNCRNRINTGIHDMTDSKYRPRNKYKLEQQIQITTTNTDHNNKHRSQQQDRTSQQILTRTTDTYYNIKYRLQQQ